MLLLFGIFYQFGFDTGRLEVEPYNHTQHYSERSDIEIENICASKLTKEEAIKCAIEAKTKPRNAKREERDLGAQISMSRWAWWMILVTGIIGLMTVGVTGLGVWWVGETLEATRETLREAKRNTKAAEDAVKESKVIGQAQTRAYVWATDPEFDFTTVEGKQVCKAKFHLINSGNSPARIVRDSSALFLVKEDFNDEFPKGELMRDVFAHSGRNTFIPKEGSTMVHVEPPFDQGQITRFKSGDFVALIMAQVIFEDVFDKRFGLDICFRCAYGDDGETKAYMYKWHNRPQYPI